MTRLSVLTTVMLAVVACVGEAQVAPTRQEISGCSVVGDLEVRALSSKVFHNVRMLRVWLPPGYRSPEHRREHYPVLYLNDGQDVFDACTSIFNHQEWRADETATALIRSRKIPAMIIVGIDNAGKTERPKEYLPFPDDTLKPLLATVHGKDYPRFLVDEVMPFIEREYRADPAPANTGLGGSSYGAGIALYTVMERPGRFGKLLLESPSVYAHDNYLLRRAEGFTQWPAKIFVGVGSVAEPVDDVRRIKKMLRRDGFGRERLLVLEKAGGEHNENAWAERFPSALEFLYGWGRH
jgi:predicted alpha/beta superfamily hydrolase